MSSHFAGYQWARPQYQRSGCRNHEVGIDCLNIPECYLKLRRVSRNGNRGQFPLPEPKALTPVVSETPPVAKVGPSRPFIIARNSIEVAKARASKFCTSAKSTKSSRASINTSKSNMTVVYSRPGTHDVCKIAAGACTTEDRQRTVQFKERKRRGKGKDAVGGAQDKHTSSMSTYIASSILIDVCQLRASLSFGPFRQA